MSKYKLGIVILTWNSQGVIDNCIDSIDSIYGYNIHIVVVDNGSTDETVQLMKQKQTQCKVKIDIIQMNKNLGTTVSRNMAIRKLNDCDYVMVLDSDTVINKNAVDSMITVLNQRGNNGIVGPKMFDQNGVIQNSGRKIPTLTIKLLKVLPIHKLKNKGESLEFYNDFGKKDVMPVGYLMSACWMIKQEVIQQIGYLDENIFYAPEDVEYCIRAWKNGYRVLYNSNAQIIHEWQRLSRKKLLSKHNWEHIKGLCYLFHKYKYCFHADKIEQKVK